MRDALRLFARDLKKARADRLILARLQQVERVFDGFERIVDLVRDGGGKASDRRQLLRLEQLLFDAAALQLAYLREVVQD